MWTYLIGYSVIFIVIIFVAFVELTAHHVIFKHSPKIQAALGHPLLRYSIRRIGSALISILLAVTATFLLIRVKSEGTQLCSQAISSWAKLSPEIQNLKCNALKESLGVAGNWFESLMTYYYKLLPFPKTICHSSVEDVIVNGIVTYRVVNQDCRNFIMDLGTVYFLQGSFQGQYVIDVIFTKMGISFQIGIIACIIEVCLGYPMGIMMAKHKDGAFDKIGKGYIISVDAIPGVAYYYIWLALFMAIGLPVIYKADNPLTFIAPALTMGLTGMAGIALWVRRFMLDEFNSDYVKFARSKGLSENRILYTHVLRNAVVPLIRSIPAAILGALLGTFYIEKIYGIDGIGGLLITANDQNDFYVLQGIIVVSAIISIVSYLLGDIVTAMVDPRVSFTED
jgi:ABC-type dipeptide/oligopeptide/nickel transport system permease component